MSLIDWTIVCGLLVILFIAAQRTRAYCYSIVNFLAAGRCAGRYLIAVAGGVSGWGALSAVAAFELYYAGGLSIQWWSLLVLVTYFLLSMAGWLLFRFRETRAVTLPEFLEKRYSRRFRVFAGILAWGSGVMNFGLFPAVGARFFQHFCGLPEVFYLGVIPIYTYPLTIFILLSISLYFIFIGGQVAVIVTDFLQGMFCMIVFVVLMIVLYSIFSWDQISAALTDRPPGESMIHPFQGARTKDFNMWYYFLFSFFAFYCWLGVDMQGYRAAAINAHEARMATIINNWRSISQQLIIILLPICAYAFLHHSDFSTQAAEAHKSIAAVVGRDVIETATLQKQMTTPIAMSFYLGKGMLGAVCAVMLAAFISTHDTYLHCWGSVFIQDVVTPFRKKPLTEKQHINLLRCSILGVAVFVAAFSLLYRQNEYILMFMMFTGTIFFGGAGAVLIGGLYWKHGTTKGAWGALITGMVLAFAGAITRRIWPEFPINSQWMFFIAAVTCSVIYVVLSLTDRKIADMDRILNRGKYAISEDAVRTADKPVSRLRKLIVMGPEFTTSDKIIYISSICWTSALILVFIAGTVYHLLIGTASETWSEFWWVYILINFVLSVITAVWFLLGGIRDWREMFRRLKLRKVDAMEIQQRDKAEPEGIRVRTSTSGRP